MSFNFTSMINLNIWHERNACVTTSDSNELIDTLKNMKMWFLIL